jgi:ABC-type nitrate/sulfonate/bicarbonate transport system permease component
MYTIQLPAILPHLLGPVRLVVAFSIGISVVAEYLASPTGIGRVMKYSMAFANVGLIMVGVLWAVALAFVFDAMTVFTIGAFTRWTGRRQLLEWMARAG